MASPMVERRQQTLIFCRFGEATREIFLDPNLYVQAVFFTLERLPF